jgi:PAS domain-containing protein/nitrogen-specific signal transduction histidine kinase
MQQVIRENLDKEETYQLLDMIDLGVYWKDCDGHYLGCNHHFLEALGLTNRTQVIGKTDHDFFSKEDADQLKVNDALAIQNTKFVGEESVWIKGQLEYYSSTKTRLVDITGTVIGVFGSSICITDIKNKSEQEKKLAVLEEEVKMAQIVDLVPAFIYWKHKNEHYIACNQYQKDMWGFDFAGKTEYDVWPEEADKIHAIDQYVLEHGNYSGEEIGKDPIDGTTKYYFSSKRQLCDSKGNVMGIIGVSMDITDRKNAERLLLENQGHKTIQEQQQKFKKIVEQVVHDIRSPIGSMKMILPACKNLPELERVSLNKAATRIMDIAYRLLNEVSPPQEEIENNPGKANVPTLISNEILEVIAEKRYEYQEKTIDFCTHISPEGYFSFLNTNVSDFKRMLSNLLNNAVDAIQDNMGKIDVYLKIVDNQIQMVIQDNGSGMPVQVKEKILDNISVSSGKADGHGIGFSQIRDTLDNSHGKLDIESSIGVGTKIILTFPEAESPDWIANQIRLSNDDIIVILDDDESIHGAWETRFQTTAPNILRKHFEQGIDAIAFINHLDKSEKEKIFLLTDYELLDQELHGLNVVKETGVVRSILVTSHNNSEKVRGLAKAHNTKILPKPLAAYIPIEVRDRESKFSHPLKTEPIAPETAIDNELKKVDIVVVEDNKTFSNSLVAFVFDDKTVDQYFKPEDFLKNIHTYPKDTKIYLDNNYDNSSLKGINIAKELHEQGYERLYLLSGEVFRKEELPSYLTILEKTDIDSIENSKNE